MMTTCEIAGELNRLLDRLQGVLGSLDACGETLGVEFDTSDFYPGVNLPGFDFGKKAGDNEPGKHMDYACVSNGIIDWVHGDGKNGVKLIRLPIQPQYIFETGPDAEEPWTFNTVFTGPGDDCRLEWPKEGFQPDYMAPLRYATAQGIFTILDVHSNAFHLCALGQQLTPEQFTKMWEKIAQYVIDNVPEHQYVIFELFNEPVDGTCGSLDADAWNKDYVIKTIEAIRKIEAESNHSDIKHVILATTYGDWAGVHSWARHDSVQLVDLAKALDDKGLTTKENVLISGHQYCNADFSGHGANGCDSDAFSLEKQRGWVDYVDKTLKEYNLKWMMTEGNITCSPPAGGNPKPCCCSCLWTGTGGWLDLLKNSETCVGFTVWLVSEWPTIAENNMGSNSAGSNSLENWELYRTIYPTREPESSAGRSMYDFSKWLK